MNIPPIRPLQASFVPRLASGEHNAMTYIYFIEAKASGMIKIGRAKNIVKRLMALQSASPETLRVLWWFEAPGQYERDLHRYFWFCHHHGEWFTPHEKLINFIEGGSHLISVRSVA